MSTETNAKIKTETVACDHNVKQVRFMRKAGPAGDQKAWPVTHDFTVNLEMIPDSLLCNDGSFTSLKAYGARALLMDRASDFRKFGAVEYMREMERLYNELLLCGRFDAERKAAAPKIDPYLIQAVANAKGLDYTTAQIAVGKLAQAERDIIAGKLASQIQALRDAASMADADLLADLL